MPTRRKNEENPAGDQGKRESGNPGGGQGRVDEVGHTGVYPASGPWPEGNAEIQTPAAWGQGERGAAGYEDHGSSELTMMPDDTVIGGGVAPDDVPMGTQGHGETF